MADPARILELYSQAIDLGLAYKGAGGKLDFFMIANRARTRGARAGALFMWLLKHCKHERLTYADEEVALKQIKRLDGYPDPKSRPEAKPVQRVLTEEQRIVEVCIQVAKRHRVKDPFKIAQQVKGWTRDQWNVAHLSYQQRQ